MASRFGDWISRAPWRRRRERPAPPPPIPYMQFSPMQLTNPIIPPWIREAWILSPDRMIYRNTRTGEERSRQVIIQGIPIVTSIEAPEGSFVVRSDGTYQALQAPNRPDVDIYVDRLNQPFLGVDFAAPGAVELSASTVQVRAQNPARNYFEYFANLAQDYLSPMNYNWMGDELREYLALRVNPAAPDPVQRKINGEIAWLQHMHHRALQQARWQAHDRAKALVEELFGAETQDDRGCIRVESTLFPNRLYWIPREGDMVIVQEPRTLLGDKQGFSLCAGPGGCPGPDKAIAQALFLAADEKAFLAVAIPYGRIP